MKFSLKSKIFNKNGQVGAGTGNDTIFSRLSLQINFSVDFLKRGNLTEDVVFVSLNFSIHQGQYQRPNNHCHSHSDSSEIYLVCYWLLGKKICLFCPFLKQISSVRPTRVVKFAWRFLFRLVRARVIMKWSLQFHLNENGNQ